MFQNDFINIKIIFILKRINYVFRKEKLLEMRKKIIKS